MSFIRQKEDFICDFCKKQIKGDGYTNHCVDCLHSKHVDVDPGDRLSDCKGLMRPIYVSYTSKDPYILHKCLVCGFERKNKIQSNDSIDMMIKIQSNSN